MGRHHVVFWCSGFLHLGQGYLAAKTLAIASECAGMITRWNFDAGVREVQKTKSASN